MKTIKQNLIIPATKPRLIADATDVFLGYIDSNFKNYTETIETPETEVNVLEITENGTFKQIFDSISTDTDSLVMTQSQIISFCEKHKRHLRKDGFGTFFLFKNGDEFFVAYVSFGDGGRLELDADRFSYDVLWYAESRHRIVVPATAQKLEISNTQSLKSLNARVEKLEEIVENVSFFEEPEKPKYRIEEFPEFVGKKRQELYDHLKEKGYKLATEEDLQLLGDECKDGNLYYAFGSIFRYSDGSWDVPCFYWVGSKWHRDGIWLDDDWNGNERVVLLEK